MSSFCAAGSEWKHCPAIRDESDNCDVFYGYHYNPDVKTVQVQKTKRTYQPLHFTHPHEVLTAIIESNLG